MPTFSLFVDTTTDLNDAAVLLQLLAAERAITISKPDDGRSGWPATENLVQVDPATGLHNEMFTTRAPGGRGVHRLWHAHRCRHLAQATAPDGDALLQRLALIAAGTSLAPIAATDLQLAYADSSLQAAGVMSFEEAAALFGLWSRRHNRQLFLVEPGFLTNTSAWFTYWVATRAALPGAWVYVSSCRAVQAHDQRRTGDLALSAITRLARALRARDEIHWSLWSEPRSHLQDELPYHLDVFLLLIGAAFDATARAASLIYQPSRRSTNGVAWHDKELIRSVAIGAPTLAAAATEPGAVARRRLIRHLRNSIHEEPLDGVSAGRTKTFELSLKPAMSEEIGQLGEATWESFGMRWQGDALTVDVGRFVEATIVHVLGDINSLMLHTHVDSDAGPFADRPPLDDPSFGRRASKASLLLTGLAEFAEEDDVFLRAQG